MVETIAEPSRLVIRALVASACPAMLEGLASILQRESHIQVVSRELDGVGALRSAVNLKPDVTILDWQLGGSHAAILVYMIRTRHRHARIVILSDLNKDAEIVPALRSGAVGYIDRNSSPEEIVACVEQVHAGHRHLAPIAAMRLGSSVRFNGLTAREKQIVELLGNNKTDREIAGALRISHSTVRSHVTGLFMKLNARSRTEAIDVAIECGLLRSPLGHNESADRESASIN